jgi:hypothetical protein
MSTCSTVAVISKALFATDFSKESMQTVDWARGVSQWYGAKLHVPM